jgi:hypothetical protein
VDNYPEAQSVAYAQWFAYAYALWDEQFRSRIADYFNVDHNDVKIPYFGDFRRIRHDFVHNKGICDASVKTEVLQWNFVKGQPLQITPRQMMSLVEWFPRDELRSAPTPKPGPA